MDTIRSALGLKLGGPSGGTQAQSTAQAPTGPTSRAAHPQLASRTSKPAAEGSTATGDYTRENAIDDVASGAMSLKAATTKAGMLYELELSTLVLRKWACKAVVKDGKDPRVVLDEMKLSTDRNLNLLNRMSAIALLEEGHSAQEIADKLHLSEKDKAGLEYIAGVRATYGVDANFYSRSTIGWR